MRASSVLGAAAALMLVLALPATATAGTDTQNGVTQSFDLTVKPNKKLPKKAKKKAKPKGVSANIAVAVGTATGQKPPAAENVILDLDKDLAINPKGLARCNPNSIATANVANARSVCKKSIVGTGDATATCSDSPTPDIPDVTVTAFNGTKQGKRDVILLHTVADLGGTNQIQILPAVLKQAPGKALGIRADIAVPPLAGGACSIVDFQVTLKKTFKKKGKKNHYVSAVCSDRTWEFASEFRFVQPNAFGVTSLRPGDEQACTQKK
jgi:hypothetical protein